MQWAKVDTLGSALERSAEDDDLAGALIETLSGADARGPLEQAADSMFVVGQDFGTRCTTVLTVNPAGCTRFIEQRFDAAGEAAGRSEFEFSVAS